MSKKSNTKNIKWLQELSETPEHQRSQINFEKTRGGGVHANTFSLTAKVKITVLKKGCKYYFLKPNLGSHGFLRVG